METGRDSLALKILGWSCLRVARVDTGARIRLGCEDPALPAHPCAGPSPCHAPATSSHLCPVLQSPSAFLAQPESLRSRFRMGNPDAIPSARIQVPPHSLLV